LKKHSFIIISFLVFNALGYSQLSDLYFLPPLKQGSNNLAVKEQTISIETVDQRVFLGSNETVGLSSAYADKYQWQVSTDGGSTFNTISDGTEYTGTQTSSLTIQLPRPDKNGYVYRVVLLSATFVFGQTISDEVVLSVGPSSIITNKRITFRWTNN
jgi:hypothetical protein